MRACVCAAFSRPGWRWFQVLRMKVCYWQEKVPGTYSADRRFPCFILIDGEESKGHVYGLPSHEYPGLVKVGRPGNHGNPTRSEEAGPRL